MDEADWERLSVRLRRLLSIEEKVFHETSGDAPVVTWLVVRIDAVAGIRRAEKGGRVRLLGDVLEGVALLYQHAAVSKSKVAFWKRVVASPMMRDRAWANNGDTISRYTRLLAETPMCLLFDWSYMGMAVSDIAPVLERVLLFPQQHQAPQVRPLTLGLRLSGCRVTQGRLETLDQVLAKCRDGRSAETPMLIATDHIGRLDLSGVRLSRHCVDALVRLLHHHDVWDLRLDQQTLAKISHLPSIDALISSALSAPPLSSYPKPTWLSFGNNALTVKQLKTIAIALEKSTRPLAGLSLAKSLPPGYWYDTNCAWWWLARIMFSLETLDPNNAPDARDIDTAELDLSDTTISDRDIRTFRDSLAAMVRERVGREGGADATNVWCKIHPAPPDRSTHERVLPTVVLDATAEYRVDELQLRNKVQLSHSDQGTAAWVPIEAIATFRWGNLTLRLCPRFNSLVLNNAMASPTNSHTVTDWIAAVGLQLRRIRARSNYVNFVLPRIADVCSHLTHLDLVGPSMTYQLSTVRGSRLLPCLRQFTFHVSGVTDIAPVERFVDDHPTIEVLELIYASHLRGNEPFAQRCQQLVKDYDGRELEKFAPVATRQKLAFLSVPTVERLAQSIVAIVWAFGASRVTRCVRW